MELGSHQFPVLWQRKVQLAFRNCMLIEHQAKKVKWVTLTRHEQISEQCVKRIITVQHLFKMYCKKIQRCCTNTVSRSTHCSETCPCHKSNDTINESHVVSLFSCKPSTLDMPSLFVKYSSRIGLLVRAKIR